MNSKIRLRSPDGSERIFQVRVARGGDEREQGLMLRREPLASDEGMLFEFDPPEVVSFWMKDTLIPLEIGYFDERGVLFETHPMRVETDPSRPVAIYSSSKAARYALEVAPGGLTGLKGWRLA